MKKITVSILTVLIGMFGFLSNIFTQSNTLVRITFTPEHSLAVGEQSSHCLSRSQVEKMLLVIRQPFPTTLLRFAMCRVGTETYLPEGAFFVPPIVAGNTVTLAATSLAGESNGDGTLAVLTFEVVTVKDLYPKPIRGAANRRG